MFTKDFLTRKIQYVVETDDSDYSNNINVSFSMKESF